MAKRPPGKGKGKGADIFLGEQDTPPARKRRTPKGQGADVFLGAEGGPQPAKPSQPKRPPLLAPAAMEAALEVACRDPVVAGGPERSRTLRFFPLVRRSPARACWLYAEKRPSSRAASRRAAFFPTQPLVASVRRSNWGT
jgi:hypothetical protein